MADLTELNDSNFQAEVLQSEGPVLVDFWGPSCAPCRQIAPIIEELAVDNAGRIKVAKADVSDCPETATQYQIFGIPTLMIFKGGEVVERLTGFQQKKALQDAIDQAIA